MTCLATDDIPGDPHVCHSPYTAFRHCACSPDIAHARLYSVSAKHSILMVGCPRTRVAQQVDVKQPVHVVPLPCPLVAPAISVSVGINQQASSIRANASYSGSSAPARAVDSLAAEALPLREIDSVAKASGKSSPYVLGRKYSKHVVGVLRGLHDTFINDAHVLALLRLWLLPSRPRS